MARSFLRQPACKPTGCAIHLEQPSRSVLHLLDRCHPNRHEHVGQSNWLIALMLLKQCQCCGCGHYLTQPELGCVGDDGDTGSGWCSGRVRGTNRTDSVVKGMAFSPWWLKKQNGTKFRNEQTCVNLRSTGAGWQSTTGKSTGQWPFFTDRPMGKQRQSQAANRALNSELGQRFCSWQQRNTASCRASRTVVNVT